VKSANNPLWPILLAFLIGVFHASPASALRVNSTSSANVEKFIFSFDSDSLSNISVRRSGPEAISVNIPQEVWQAESKPSSKDFPGMVVKSMRATQNGVELVTSTNAFGFIKVPSPGKSEFVVQVYRDAYGARWKAPTSQQGTDTATKSSDSIAAQSSPQRSSSQPEIQVEQSSLASNSPSSQPVAGAGEQAAQSRPTQPQGEVDLPPESEERQPFFSVPYSVRTKVSPPGTSQPEASQPNNASQSGDSGSQAVNRVSPDVVVDSSETRIPLPTANPTQSQSQVRPEGGPVQVKIRLPQSQEASPEPEVTPPADVSERAVIEGPPAQPRVATDGDGQVSMNIGPPPDSPNQDGRVGISIAPPVENSGNIQQKRAVNEGAQPIEGAEISPEGGVVVTIAPPSGGQSVRVSPPPTVVEGAPPPQPTQEEIAEASKSVAPSAENLTIQQQMALQEGRPLPSAENQSVEAIDPQAKVENGTDQGLSGQDIQGRDGVEASNATLAEEARLQAIRDKLYEAQSMMFNGALENALTMFEDILKQPGVPDDVREETLYAIADIKKQVHSDDVEAHYDELSQSFIEAMNSNLRSTRLPRALLNLGLLNLQVGNFPEAKAYFKILQDKFPDDDNIPSISYYWGEYYYKKGDYKKAADQFQYLIQTYPEHELVKPAAYYLADSLNRTGFTDQAFQIVDYIDKRWPDYYMENAQFLRLAGGVEMKLKKWEQAKNHYFTYYNLNPEAEGADIVLAQIGDIYIREKEQDAAKQIYQKAVKDFPDKDGGLVSKMRLAEEGIYDEPAMSEMATVFDRPYNKRPENIYKEIVEEHPQSPLAPIAQLKLAMWYAFNKKYPEALAAAQDFIDKYPASPLIDRARKLGDSVFALAVPGMVEEGRYGRVVRYWETYDFIGKKDTKVDDSTRLNVATSYWKVGQPEKALELIKPFLTQKQRLELSEEALGLAVNIYLDQLAWSEIADLVAMAKKNWKLKPAQLRQLDYARAMSLQNLGEANKALAMWADLAKDMKVAPAFRAYAMYYMAKAAMDRQDLRKVFVYAQEALSLLLQTSGDPEKIKDAVLMSIYATERSGRYSEALKWAKEYDNYIDVDNPEWASTRFKLARIYRKAGAIDEWKQLLEDIIEKKPETLQAQLAQSALDSYALEQQVQQYAPAPQ